MKCENHTANQIHQEAVSGDLPSIPEKTTHIRQVGGDRQTNEKHANWMILQLREETPEPTKWRA